MKTILIAAALSAVLVIGCSNKEKEDELQKQLSQVQNDRTTLQQSITERDSYFDEVMKSVNEVYADIETARQKEKRLAENAQKVEGPAQFTNLEVRQKLLQNINDLGSALKENRKKISDLQSKVRSFNGKIAGLNTMIENLKVSLQEREQSIAQLEGRVQGLETTVAEKTKVIADKETMIDQQTKKINTVFYVAGTREEQGHYH
jgi:chromosome segregation ATPase